MRTNWTDFQKKMGLVSYCCLRQDSEALNLEALCYRKGDTPRTMFMLALLMDEMDYEDINKFRELYKSQLDPEYASKVGPFDEHIWELYAIWREMSMYPFLLPEEECPKVTSNMIIWTLAHIMFKLCS